MGLLTAGKPLSWEDSLKFVDYIKDHGIEQFINIYNQYKNNTNDPPFWGDEIEYILVHLPENNPNTVQLSLRSKQIQDDVLQYMSNFNNINNNNNNSINTSVVPSKAPSTTVTDIEKCIVHPEYGSHMIESTPLVPYTMSGEDLLSVSVFNYSFFHLFLQTYCYLLLFISFILIFSHFNNIPKHPTQ